MKTTNANDSINPWYKEPWPWIIMAFPFASVVLGILMLTLALTTNNSLVVDDYYKQGKGINQRIARDRMASELGISANVIRTKQGIEIVLSEAVGSEVEPATSFASVQPAEFTLRWSHITQSEKDGSSQFRPVGGGKYTVIEGDQFPAQGRFRLHIQPASNEWRLVSPVLQLEDIDSVVIYPAYVAVPGVAS